MVSTGLTQYFSHSFSNHQISLVSIGLYWFDFVFFILLFQTLYLTSFYWFLLISNTRRIHWSLMVSTGLTLYFSHSFSNHQISLVSIGFYWFDFEFLTLLFKPLGLTGFYWFILVSTSRIHWSLMVSPGLTLNFSHSFSKHYISLVSISVKKTKSNQQKPLETSGFKWY